MMAKRLAIAFIVCILTVVSSLFAQQETGSITGQIVDPSGAAVPGAQLTITNQSTNIPFDTTSDATGLYSAPQLAPGIYSVTVRATGFKSEVRPEIEVRVNDRLGINFSLQVGAVTQTVEVFEAAPLLQTEDNTAGEVIDTQRTQELPLNGRNFLQLATLAPATVPYPAQSGQLPENTNMNLGGTPTSEQNYLVNGMDMTFFISSGGPIAAPPIDAIQEFKVETNDYSADSGRLGGAVLNSTIKSGTNAFHGTAYDFLRNAELNARNALDETGSKPEFTRNQFGGSIGGPFAKNKLFFFVNYEGYRQRQYAIDSTNVYTAAQKLGDFSSQLGSQIGTDALGRPVFGGEIFNPFTVRQVTAGLIDPVSGLMANQTTYIRDPYGSSNAPTNVVTNINSVSQALINIVPAPNQAAGVFPNFVRPISNPLNIDTWVGRLDWNKSTKDSINGFILDADAQHNTQPVLGYPADGGCGCGQVENQRMFVSGWTHIFNPTNLNEFRIAFVRNTSLNSSGSGSDMSSLNPQFGLPFPFQGPYVGGMTGIDVSNYTHIGTSEHDPFFQYTYKYEITDTYTHIRGNHQLKAGVWLMRQNFYNQKNCNFCRGTLGFNGIYTSQIGFNGATGSSVADFLSGVVDSSNDGTVTNEKDVGHDVEWFVEDTWHVSHKLSVTPGVRYQWDPPSWEYRGDMSSVTFGAGYANPELVVPTNMSTANYNLMANTLFPYIPVVRATNLNLGLTHNFYTNFAPRLGIAYQVTPKTVIRTGWGVFYGFPELLSGAVLTVNPPSKLLIGVAADGVNPTYTINSNPFGASPFTHALLNPNFFSIRNPDLKPEFTQMWNFIVQHQLPKNWLLELGYLGNSTGDKYVINEVNDAFPALPGDVSSPQSRRMVSTLLGNLPELTPQGKAHYNALYFNVNKRFSQGLSILANYTWSRALGIGQDIVDSINNLNSSQFQNPNDLQRAYGPLEFDVENHMSISLLYELPFGKGKAFMRDAAPVVNQIIGGWQVNTIVTAQGGFPITPTLGFSLTNTYANSLPNLVGNPYAGAHVAPNQWLNPAAYAIPTSAQISAGDYYGNVGINSVREPAWANWDLSFFKMFPVTEKVNLQFRAEIFNFTNTPNWGLPGAVNTTIGTGFGTIGMAGDPRVVQIALKINF
jgi:hypothetical protein